MVVGSETMCSNPANYFDSSYSYRLMSLANLWRNFPVVTGLPSNTFLTKEGSPIDVPLGENEVAEFSPSAVKCLHCLKYYSGFDMLKEHIQLCHPERALGFSCVQCNAAFSNREQLEKHQVLHSPESQVSCSVCNKNFANVYRLQRHMISHDESAVLRKFKCPQCEKAFKFKHHLKEHIRIHSGEKPFACEHCGKRFSHSGSYSSHNTSKKCLIMNLKVNHRNRNTAAAADPNKSVANGQQPNANLVGSRVSAKSKMPNSNNNNNNTSVNNNNTKNVTNNNHHLNNHNNNNNVINNNHTNNNNLPFASILPKYPDGAGILLPAYPINPFCLPPGFTPYFPPNINQLLEQFTPIAAYRENSKELEEAPRSVASGEDGTEIVIKKEIKMEEEEFSSASSSTSTTLPAAVAAAPAAPPSANDRRTGNDLEAVKRILESVNESVTKQPFPPALPKLPSTSCSSGCPSISSEVPSSPAVADDTSQPHDSAAAMAAAAACKFCGRVCHSMEERQQHEKFICSVRDDTKKSEGLAARLHDIISSQHEETGLSAFNSDDDDEMQGSEKEVTVTEDEDFDGVSDGRKVRVRSQIAEEQLVVLKQHYAHNPRPKREELEVISQRVGFPVRVVQVWFQNNRARDRREGRFVPIPYAPAVPYPPSGSGTNSISDQYPGSELSPRLLVSTSATLMDQPLDLSKKKSNTSSPASSPYPYDSDECGAVNLSSRKSPPSAHLLQQHHHQVALAVLHSSSTSCCPPTTPPASVQQLTATLLDVGAAHPTTTPPLTPEKRLLPYHPQRVPGTPNNSANSIFFSMERIVYSPVTSSSPIYNGSCSPNSSDSWKQEYLHSNDLELKDESRMGEDNMSFADCRTVVTSTKKPKMNCNNSTDSENKGDRPHRCDICPKAFKHKHHLTEHKRLHSGEKPFQCKKCLKRFSHSGSYSQHKNHRFSYCKPYRD